MQILRSAFLIEVSRFIFILWFGIFHFLQRKFVRCHLKGEIAVPFWPTFFIYFQVDDGCGILNAEMSPPDIFGRLFVRPLKLLTLRRGVCWFGR